MDRIIGNLYYIMFIDIFSSRFDKNVLRVEINE